MSELRCTGCGIRYSEFPLDVVLPDDQWAALNGREGGVLCAACIVERGAALPGVTVAHLRFDRHHPSPQGVRVPDALGEHYSHDDPSYNNGWNDCRAETLRLNPQPGAPIKENEIYTKPIDARPGAVVGDFDLLMKAVAEAEVKACACDFNHLESVTLFITKRYNELCTLTTKDTP